MIGLNAISYGNPVLDEKVNYFVDYFEYCNEMVGSIYGMELETPLSLADKIMFQLQHNNKNDKIINYLYNYFGKVIAFNHPFLNRFTNWQPVILFITPFMGLTKTQRKQWMSSNREAAIATIKRLRDELEKKMFKQSIEEIIHILKLPSALPISKQIIQFHTHLLVCELLFNRESKTEVTKIFRQIFAEDFRWYPYTKRMASKSKEQKEQYFKRRNRKFESPYRAIHNFLEKSDNIKYVIFKIDNLVFPQEYEFPFDGAIMCSTTHIRMKHLESYLHKQSSGNVRKVFGSTPYTVCIVPAEHPLRTVAYKRALKKVATVMLYFNTTLNKSCIIDRYSYLFTRDFTDFDAVISIRPTKESFTLTDISRLKDNVYFDFIRKSFKAKGKLLEPERTFIEARKTDDITGLWNYIENMTGKPFETTSTLIAGAMLKGEKQFTERAVEDYLKNAIHPINCSYKRVNITLEQQDRYSHPSFKLKKGKPVVGSPLFMDTLASLNVRYTKDRYKKVYDYYISILTEAYEQRNLNTHSGIQHSKATVKLLYTFNTVLTRFRWAVFDYALKYPKAGLSIIFDKMEADYRKMLP